jgi:hypothetical protein
MALFRRKPTPSINYSTPAQSLHNRQPAGMPTVGNLYDAGPGTSYAGFPSYGGFPQVDHGELMPLEGHPGQFVDGRGKGGRMDELNYATAYNVYNQDGGLLGQNLLVMKDGIKTEYGYSKGIPIPARVNFSDGSAFIADSDGLGNPANTNGPSYGGFPDPSYGGFPAPSYGGFPQDESNSVHAITPTHNPASLGDSGALSEISGHPGQFTDGRARGAVIPGERAEFKYPVYDKGGKFLGVNEVIDSPDGHTENGYSYGTPVSDKKYPAEQNLMVDGKGNLYQDPAASGFGPSDAVDRWQYNHEPDKSSPRDLMSASSSNDSAPSAPGNNPAPTYLPAPQNLGASGPLTALPGHPGQFTDGRSKGGMIPGEHTDMTYPVYDQEGKLLGVNEVIENKDGSEINKGYSYGTPVSNTKYPNDQSVMVDSKGNFYQDPAATGYGPSDAVDRALYNKNQPQPVPDLNNDGVSNIYDQSIQKASESKEPDAIDRYKASHPSSSLNQPAAPTPAEPVVYSVVPEPSPSVAANPPDAVDRFMANSTPTSTAATPASDPNPGITLPAATPETSPPLGITAADPSAAVRPMPSVGHNAME